MMLIADPHRSLHALLLLRATLYCTGYQSASLRTAGDSAILTRHRHRCKGKARSIMLQAILQRFCAMYMFPTMVHL